MRPSSTPQQKLLETTTQKNSVITVQQNNSLTFKHRITPDELKCH